MQKTYVLQSLLALCVDAPFCHQGILYAFVDIIEPSHRAIRFAIHKRRKRNMLVYHRRVVLEFLVKIAFKDPRLGWVVAWRGK